MEYCQSKHMTIFLGSIYMYKGVLMVSGPLLGPATSLALSRRLSLALRSLGGSSVGFLLAH